MDQTILYSQMMEWVFSTLLPILGIVSPVVIYLHMSHKGAMKDKADKRTVEDKLKDLDSEMAKKVDLTAYKTKMESLDGEIKTIKTTSSEDRLIFLNEVKELRKDLRLKKDKP